MAIARTVPTPSNIGVTTVSVHVPALSNLSSWETPITASRDLITTVAKAAPGLGETIVDTVSDGVSAVSDGVANLLPSHRRSNSRVVVTIATAVLAMVAIALVARRRAGAAHRMTRSDAASTPTTAARADSEGPTDADLDALRRVEPVAVD